MSLGTPLLDYHTDVQRVYLLDPIGAVLAPDDGAVPLGQMPPEVGPARVAALYNQALASGRDTVGVLAEASYTTTGPRRAPLGVELFAIRYHTASACQDPRGRALGIVEVATSYPTVQAVLRRLRMVLIVAVLAVFAAGLLIGGPVTAGALRPLTRVTRTARRIASGDLSQRVDCPTPATRSANWPRPSTT